MLKHSVELITTYITLAVGCSITSSEVGVRENCKKQNDDDEVLLTY